jgi:uncharacterized protein YfkK (UPF0435 family)
LKEQYSGLGKQNEPEKQSHHEKLSAFRARLEKLKQRSQEAKEQSEKSEGVVNTLKEIKRNLKVQDFVERREKELFSNEKHLSDMYGIFTKKNIAGKLTIDLDYSKLEKSEEELKSEETLKQKLEELKTKWEKISNTFVGEECSSDQFDFMLHSLSVSKG